ncbi:MAG: M23 family metallopeptidase [Anaerolineae bacterium]|jgi:hypothetical protein|nr:M23 family metallopeptidase [Anaerolineae bacterium]
MFFLAACTGASPQDVIRDPLPIIDPTSTQLEPTTVTTIVAPTQKPTLTTTPVISNTPTIAPLPYFQKGVPELCDQSWCVYSFETPFIRPISVDYNQRVDLSYRYGSTQEGKRKVHKGVEFINPTGTPVHAIGNGTVIVAETDHFVRYGPVIDFYGNLVIIEHDVQDGDRPVYSLYGHLSEIMVQPGQQVKAGDLIGKVGATGSALGSHLHLEVRFGENNYVSTVNPELVLPPPNDPPTGSQTGILVLRMQSQAYSIFSIPIWVDRIDSNDTNPVMLESYFNKAPRSKAWDEVGVIGDLTEGNYHLSFYKNGAYFETTFHIYSGKMTVLDFEF